MRRRNGSEKYALFVAIAVGAGVPGVAAHADTLEDVQAQMKLLQGKVSELEQQQQASQRKQDAVAASAVTAGATKGSLRLPGSNTSVTVGGYVKLDAVFGNPSAGVNTTADLFLQPNAIPVGPGAGDNEHDQVKFGARESRLFVKTSTPTAWGDLTTYVEGDFYGADGNESVSNSNGPRLRHAYGALGHLLGGQTWTNFMYVPSLPETLDFGGPVGQVFDRQAQLRWTQAFDAGRTLGAGQWSIALENPESVVTVPGGASFRADDDHVPDLTGQVVFGTPRGKFAVSAIVREVRADSRTPAVVDRHAGGALSVAGVIPVIGNDDLRFVATAGNAIGRYSNGFFPDGIVDADGRLALPRQWGWYAGYRHFWRQDLRSSLVLSGAGETAPAGTPGSTNRSTHSLHANLIWSPIANADLGVEYIHADRETEDGLKGRLNRFQASAKYAF
jgi:hypothetical protein